MNCDTGEVVQFEVSFKHVGNFFIYSWPLNKFQATFDWCVRFSADGSDSDSKESKPVLGRVQALNHITSLKGLLTVDIGISPF